MGTKGEERQKGEEAQQLQRVELERMKGQVEALKEDKSLLKNEYNCL